MCSPCLSQSRHLSPCHPLKAVVKINGNDNNFGAIQKRNENAIQKAKRSQLLSLEIN